MIGWIVLFGLAGLLGAVVGIYAQTEWAAAFGQIVFIVGVVASLVSAVRQSARQTGT